MLATKSGFGENAMNKPAVIQLRLPRSIKAGVERAAKRDGTSMNQLIATAVAEKLSAMKQWIFSRNAPSALISKRLIAS